MTLEQRIEALEKALASLTLPRVKSEELAKMMRDAATEVIRNAQRPGGMLYKNGSGKQSAEWGVKINPTDSSLTGFRNDTDRNNPAIKSNSQAIIENAQALQSQP